MASSRAPISMLNKYLLPDPKNGGPSTTRSVFAYGCLLCGVKLALSGMSLFGLSFGVFTGGDCAMVLGALGGIYALDKTVSKGPPSA